MKNISTLMKASNFKLISHAARLAFTMILLACTATRVQATTGNGRVTYNGYGVPGVTIYISGWGAVATTDGNGYYGFDNGWGFFDFGIGTLFAAKGGYSIPGGYSVYQHYLVDYSGLNFSASAGPVPTIDPIANVTGYKDTATVVNLTGIGLGDPSLPEGITLSASSSPSGPTINRNYTSINSTGTLTLIPQPGVTGTYTITVTATRSDGVATSRNFTYTVNSVNSPPVAGPGTSLEFYGSQSVSIPGGFPLANSSFTIEMWAKHTALNQDNFLFGMGSAVNNNGIHIGFRNNNVFAFAFWANDLNAPAYTDQGWHHWACVYDATSKARKIYLDGTLYASDIATSNFLGSGNATIGDIGFVSDPFKGEIADVRVWNVARSQADVANNRNSSLLPNTPGLLANYKFNEGWPTVATDLATSTSNPNQGGQQNGATVNDPAFLGGDSILGRHLVIPAGENFIIPNFGGVVPTANLTIEFWAFIDATGAHSSLFLSPDDTSNRLNIHLPWSDNQIFWDFGNINTVGRMSYTPPVSPVGRWTHFAFVVTAGSNMKIYRDGVLEAQKNSAGTLTQNSGRNLVVSPGGRMADFRIWNTARTADQIAGNRFIAQQSNTAGLVVNYRFEQLSGGVQLLDLGGVSGSQDGTASAGASFGLTRQKVLSDMMIVPVVEDAPRLVYLPAGDRDSALTYTSVSAPNGSVSQISGGIFQYTANSGFAGNDYIRYVVSDGSLLSTGSVNIAVSAVNDQPVVGAGVSLDLNQVGSGQYLQMPNGQGLGSVFTVESWVFVRSYANWSRLFDFGNGPASDDVLGALTAGTTGFPALHIYEGGSSQSIQSSQQIPLNTWAHLAFTRDAGGIGHIYINGVETAAGPVWAPLNVTRTQNYIGRSNWPSDAYANASFAEFRIWNVARTAQQLKDGANINIPVSTAGLVTDLRLNEGSGTTAFDSATSDGAQNAQVFNSPAWMNTDHPTNSITLNGTSQYSQTLDSAPISITGPITVEAWIRPNAIGTIQGIVEKYGSSDGGYAMRLEANGRISFYTLDNDSSLSSYTTLVGNTTIPANVWTHVAAVWDGLQSKIYINGALDASMLNGRNPKDGSTPLIVGATGKSSFIFNGRIGDVRIWNIARNPGDIAAGLAGVPSNAAGLVVNYKFTEATGSTINDVATGDGAQNGALQNSPIWSAPEIGLANSEVVSYVEDTPINVVLPAFDVEGNTLTYSSVSVTPNTGTMSLVSGNTYKYSPAANYNGPATITYTVTDGTTPVNGYVYLQGIPVDDAPTITSIPNQTIGEGSPTSSLVISFTDGDPELTQPMSLLVTSSDQTLVRNPGVIYTSPQETAQLNYKPRPGVSGTATITVVVTELVSLQTATQQFNILITAVDDPPNVGPATSVQFNGTNYARVAGFGNVMPTDEVTIEFWQKANSAASQNSFNMSPEDASNHVSAKAPSANGAVVWDFGNINGGGRLSYTPPVNIVGIWQHFAFVASKSGNYMKIFRNGIEEATKPGMTSFVPGDMELQLGKFAPPNPGGSLSEFRVWSVARTADDIAATMHSALSNNAPNLVAYYRFNGKPTTVLTDFAIGNGAQNGELISDPNDVDPTWQTPTGNPSWQTSDPALAALQVIRIPDGATTNLFLPAFDAEDGLNITWQNVSATTGTVSQVSGGLWAYTAPVGYDGPATLSYSVKDSGTNLPTSSSLNLRVVIAQNDPPTIASIPNVAAEEDDASIEIPFTVNDDRPASDLTITPIILANPDFVQSFAVSPGGSFRTLTVVPKPGEIGTVHFRILVQDSGGKSAQTEFDLRIEPKPAYSVFDLGVVPGKSASFGTAINDRGAVTGYMADTADLESNPVGFFFNGIENGGVVENNPPIQVGPTPLSSPFRAWAINGSYAIAGSGKNGGSTVAWYKDIENPLVNLGDLSGGVFAEIRAMNDTGYLVGSGGISGGKHHAISYTQGGGSLTDLGLAPAPFNDQSEAYGLNANNDIVGAIYAADGRKRAMFYKSGASMLPLFSVPDDTNSVAYGVNSFDQIVGSASTFSAGDTALSFDGVNDSVTQANLLTNPSGTPLVAGNSDHTIEAWVKVSALPATGSFPLVAGNIGTANNITVGAHMWFVSPSGNLSVGVSGNGGSNSVPVTLGAWMHVAAAYKAQDGSLALYVNGQLIQTSTVSGFNLQGIPLSLGAQQLGKNWFNGALDEVRVWRTTRSAAQISANYNQRLNGNETGLVVYYPFDEGSGTANTTSKATGALVATLAGSPQWTVRGGLPAPDITVSDPVLQLDGVSSYAVGPSVTLSNSSFTVEFRAKRSATNRWDIALSQGTNTASKGLHIGFRPGNEFTLAFWSNDLSTAPYLDTDWHHWAVSLNVNNGERKIYRDGVVVAQDTATAAYQGLGPLILGKSLFLGNTAFQGLIDDVRVWNIVRSADDIAANQNTRLPGSTPGLITYYTFDEGGGTVAANRVPSGGDATLQGAISWASRDTGSMRAFLYDSASGRLQSLGTLTGAGASEARSINDFAQIAGTAAKGNSTRAFFYSAGRMNDLNDLLPEADQLDQWVLESASGINRSGAVVGTGTHRGLKRAYLALPATVIGRPVIRPQGAVERLPQITILKKHLPDDSAVNSFYWSEAESKLYAIRPVTAKIEWFTSLSDTVGSGLDLTVNTNRIVSVSVNVWPKQPIIHIAGAPVDLQPSYTGSNYTFQTLIYVTNTAAVEPSSKVFTSPLPGYTVAYYLKTEGQQPNPQTQRPYFDVVRTVVWNDSHANSTSQDWTIGSEVTEPGHTEYLDKNGYVLFEQAAIDSVGTDRAYDRGTRLGPILPVNTEKPGGNLNANPDPLIVVWYRTNRIGVAWASVPIRYSLNWPSDNVVDKIIIASLLGSGELNAALYPAKTIYNQPDITLPGFNPNEEHAYMPTDTLFAIRNDLNALKNYSLPYAILKYRDKDTARWRMRVYKVIAEEAPYFFTYTGVVGREVAAPLPLSLLPICKESYQQPPTSLVGWEDYKGKIYARQAGPEGTHTNLVIRWFYPMQPSFYHPDASVKVGDALALLDRRPANKLFGPNVGSGVPGTPIDVTYDIRWDDHHILQIGETLIHSKHGLPDVFNMANAQIIFDSLNPVSTTTDSLTRFYDPISARTITTGVIIPDSIKKQNINGKNYFTDLPWMLKLRLTHDPINNWLSFSGYLDENFGVGEPLMLPNVLSERERDRLKQLADGNGQWAELIDRLYKLTRNPNGVDLSPKDGLPDDALRIGLKTLSDGTIGPEQFSGGPKALTAGIGGVPAAQPKPGNALNFDGTSGVVTIGQYNGQSLNLAESAFTIEFWAKTPTPLAEQYIVGQPSGSQSFGQIRIGFRDSGKFAFDLGTQSASESIFNTSGVYTDAGWHHWACTFDPEKKIQNIYYDGALAASRTNINLTYVGFGPVEIGRFGSQYFQGKVDEFRVWKSARTISQIQAKMNKRLLGAQTDQPSGEASELKLELLYRCDENSGPLINGSLSTLGGYPGTLAGGVSLQTSDAPAGIPPRYITIAENNDSSLAGLPVALHVIRIDDGPFLGDLKVLPGDNVFDERLTMRHSSDFGGDPGPLTFQWYYRPIGPDFDPTDLPVVTDPNAEFPSDMRGWTLYTNFKPADGKGVNYITTGEGGESGLITLSDNAFVCRYRGYNINLNTTATWSGWVGDPAGTPDQPRAALAEGWVKRVIRGLNPFDARTSDFHSSPAVTFSSMLIEAGQRYEGPIAFNPSADAINKVGLIEAYTTVLERAKGLSIDGVPQVDFNPANTALQLAATKLSDLYMLLGNEAYADASDPTIGFGTGSKEYGSLASSIFAFQNQLDSLLEEEVTLLRGRDDSAAGVGARPVYNRLFWNFTLGEGEVAYQQNYNISDQDKDGFITDKDARILYPQGHGDAWGHYLTALKQQYALLRHPFFTWIPRSELVSVAGAAIKVDFLDERKFATAAAAKAKAGAEIVDLTYRLNYVDDPAGQWQGYKDTKGDRAWGVTDWARRAGMGSYFDWIVGNTILPSEDPNPNHTGIDKIDRQTVRELQEIPLQYDEIQTRLDQADAGLNPLGLAKGVVPFDIDPSQVSAGKTHYEQIQDRALKAMNNTMSVWDEVNKATQQLRETQDTVEQFTKNVDDQERDYKNRLIEIFGYPYAGDIGPSKTYASGYDGPDLLHYMYVNTTDINGDTAPPSTNFTAFFEPLLKQFNDNNVVFPADGALNTNGITLGGGVLQVTYPFSASRFGFVPPATWGQRRAPGELQLALSDLVQAETRLKQAVHQYDNLVAELELRINGLTATYDLDQAEIDVTSARDQKVYDIKNSILAMKTLGVVMNRISEITSAASEITVESLPKVLGLASDVTSPARGVAKLGAFLADNIVDLTHDAADLSVESLERAQEDVEAAAETKLEAIASERAARDELQKTVLLLRQEAGLRLELFNQREIVNQAGGRYLAALAKGERLIAERVAFRQRVAATTTETRYQDMTFRIFRNDALQKYRATFDLAQRYVFLAATAYDYEANLLGTDSRAGQAFLTDIIRQRSLGQMLNGSPVIGRAGLADPLARMGSNFEVLKTQLGFNNPETETGRFSLRHELFRLRDSSADAWKAKLTANRVPNLWDIAEFRRYCRSFAPESAGAQPGIVIRFPTSVIAGLNYFNWPLGGGDSAYDPSRFATKVRSAGVWFSGYNGLGLSQTPRVYLVPVGSDVLSPPTPNDFTTRQWRVVDQALPVPFPIGANRLSDPKWIPVNDSLGGSFAEIRRFASFRAYHDSGDFSQTEVTTDSRLIGRSVWNTEWMLIIPGQTFLADPNAGLDTFINSVGDIKLFFQTYSYSGN